MKKNYVNNKPLLMFGLQALKGVTDNVWWLNEDFSIVEKFLRIHLRQIKRFKDL